MLGKLAELERKLRELSHDQTAIQIIQSFAIDLGNTKQRQIIFGSDGALLRDPIFYQDALEKGLLDEKEEPFNLLQGDIISTDAAYFFGERLEGMKFAIANSTCDLVPHRRQNAILFRIEAITQARYPDAKSIISQLLKFKSTQRMYLPRLNSDSEDVLANCIIFDGVVQISLDDLQMAAREASLSLIGWRIFGSLLRTIMVRAGESEVKLRTALNS
ncbi:hypothetical protein WA1_25960 [Scytonema hofmannii PCC 7110]|uniref:Uncharacterized protein n=1 Tax=Scytonema hofmannii PCC 7110 TaxID=128403 RepID=A0A139X7A2_9CYAN|nr:hypothetical protein [Scytonema hofmannii]KYC40566.1 hypothetical protein WA1_25960 [Scytonema hofmannii PCC 7110]